jgi:TonB-dependent receptor
MSFRTRWIGSASRAMTTALFLLPIFATAALAQQPGRLVGRVIDAASGQGISGAQVQVVGTSFGALAGVDGRFTIVNVPAGAVALQARRIGFGPKTVTGLQLAAGQVLEQNVALTASVVQLAATVVTASAERGSVNAALDRQRTATGVVNSVTAEQIARSPDADAAQAVQRVSGVTVQDGKYVFVRGLGERYTTASLNGTRLPSPEPERKVVPLDLFPSGLLQSVTTSKTFTPDQPGDFSGASVDIRTREFPAQRQITYSTSTGFTTNAAGRNVFAAPGVGGEALAYAGDSRNLPGAVRQAGNFQQGVSQQQKNALINSFRDVWQADQRTGTPNGSLGVSIGGSDPLFGQRVGYLVSGTYGYTQEARTDEVRALARTEETSDPVEYNRFTGTSGRTSTIVGGLANFSTLFGTGTRISVNNTFNRTSDNDARIERGGIEDLGIDTRIQRLDYVERSVFSSQLAGEHDRGRQKLDWAATVSGVTRDEPDRSEFVQEVVPGGTGGDRLLWLASSGQGAVRTFSALMERGYEGRANYQLQFGPAARQQTFKVGGLVRYTDRKADTRAYGIAANVIDDAQRALAPEQLFGGQLTAPDSARLNIVPLGQGGYYTASDALGAGFAMADLGITDRLRFIGGARLEVSAVDVDAVGTLSQRSTTARDFTDLLPSAALNFKVTENQNLRLSGSRTLARPEYRELADITTRDVIGGINLRGNPGLVRTQIDNLDARYEWYPNAGEVLSFGVFAKRFHDPIERVFQATSATAGVVTFSNVPGANNYGVELEARKDLGFVAAALEPFTAFANLTVMESKIDLGDQRGAFTESNRRLVGQAPYVVNGGVTYASRSGAASATVLYNRVGDRIYEAGVNPLPNAIEHARDMLDLSLRLPVWGALSARVDAKNLLDARYRVTQGPATREAFRSGRGFALGLSWQQ